MDQELDSNSPRPSREGPRQRLPTARGKGYLTTRQVWAECTRLALLGKPITYRALALAVGVSAVSTIWHHLWKLQDKGYIAGVGEDRKGKSGTIQILLPLLGKSNGRIIQRHL